jgi:hypothetical protein
MEVQRPIEDCISQMLPEHTGPTFKRIIDVTERTIVFDGSFRIDAAVFQRHAVHRLFHFQGHDYYVEILGKKTGETTSNYWYDEGEQGYICLSPTEIIELEYRVLEKDMSKERMYDLIQLIHEEETIIRNIHYDIWDS